MQNPNKEYRQQLDFWRYVFVAGFSLYLLNNIVLYFFVAENLGLISIAALLGIKVLPLLIFVPWLLRPNFKVAIAFCCLLLFYFTFTAFAIFQEGYRGLLAIMEGLIFLVMFWSAFKLGKMH